MNICRRKTALIQRFSKTRDIWRRIFYHFPFVILLLGLSPTAFSDLPYCDKFFTAGLSTHTEEGKVQFGRNAQLLGDNSYLVSASTVISNYYSPKKSCDDYFCRAGTLQNIVPILIPRKDTFSTHDVVVHSHKKKVLSKKTAYGRISVERNATLGFAPRTSGYTIDELNLEHKSKLQLPAGEYWVGNLSLDEEGKIEVVGDGTAILYVINDASIPAKFNINGNTKDPAKLVIYSYGNLDFATRSKTYAFIYSLGDARFDKKTKTTGAVMAKNISLGADSKVTFTATSLQNLNFNNICSGTPPSMDFTAPVIELDPFPYNILASSIVISGKVTEPDNGARWLEGVFLDEWDQDINIPLDNDGRFSIELPLTSTENGFTISARDKAGNSSSVNFTVRSEPNPEFAIRLDYFEWQLFKPLPVSGVITIPNGRTIKEAFIETAQGNIPLQLVNNRFSLYLPFVRGYNEYRVVARDQDDNEVSEMIYIEGLSAAVLDQVKIEGIGMLRPERKITGILYALWPLEDLAFSIDGIPQELKLVREGIYEFSTELMLSIGRSRLEFTVTTPEGNTFQEFESWYEPDRVYLSIDQTFIEDPDASPQILQLIGYLHIPLELIHKNLSVVITSDRHPGVETPVSTPGLNETGGGSISMGYPLEPGENNLLLKVKDGKEDVIVDVGVSQFAIQVFGN